MFSVKVAPVATREEAEYNRVTLSVDDQGVIVAPPQGNVAILSLNADARWPGVMLCAVFMGSDCGPVSRLSRR